MQNLPLTLNAAQKIPLRELFKSLWFNSEFISFKNSNKKELLGCLDKAVLQSQDISLQVDLPNGQQQTLLVPS